MRTVILDTNSRSILLAHIYLTHILRREKITAQTYYGEIAETGDHPTSSQLNIATGAHILRWNKSTSMTMSWRF